MKRLALLVLLSVFSVTLSQAEEALPQQTVSIQDLVLAVQTDTIKDYFGKDLTVTGWGMVFLGNAGKILGTIDGKEYKDAAYTAVNSELPSGAVQRDVFLLLPVTLVARFPVLKQMAMNRLSVAHVRLAWGKAFLNPDRTVLVPLDTFEVLDSQTQATTAAAPSVQ